MSTSTAAATSTPATATGGGDRQAVILKVGIVGDAQIGKTSLMVRYVHNQFDEEYIQTLGVHFMERTIQIRQTPITFSLWDLGGAREFVNMLPMVCNSAVAILYMFDLTRRPTLDSVRGWYRQVKGFNRRAIPILVGTKYDLFNELPLVEREDNIRAARRYARAMRAPLIFSSSTEATNVQNIFKIILARAFGLRLTIPEVTDHNRPLLIYEQEHLRLTEEQSAEGVRAVSGAAV